MTAPPSGSATGSQPSRVFLSYARKAKADEALAKAVRKSLTEQGYSVFMDQDLPVGEDWAAEIEAKLRCSDFMVVFLSKPASRSEMIRAEIEIARKQADSSGRGKPKILPILVRFNGSLPYPLNAYLDPLQHTLWRQESDTPKVLIDLHKVLGGGTVSISPASSFSSAEETEAPPLYAALLPPPGGALQLEDPWYLERSDDATVLSLIRQQGQTIVIKGPRQMGKSSLLVRAVAEAAGVGKKTVLLDFQIFDRATKNSSDLFFRRFLAEIVEQLGLPDEVDERWDTSLAVPQNCTHYFERQVLSRISEPLTLAIDEADALFGTSFSEDFFAMLRSWHEMRAHPLKKAWKRADLVLVISTEPSMLIDREHQSPFSVGEISRLSDFLPEQVRELIRLHGSELSDEHVSQLISLLGGHPYLTRKALYDLRKKARPEDLFENATEDNGPFGDHLRYYLLRLQEKRDLAIAFCQILQNEKCEDESLVYRLEAAGLIKRRSGKIVPRCKLYEDYFRERLHPRV
ncbi:MAG TPA: AAA-like domain-containing protein [Thermoanaerobaculia bacterium]